MEALRFRGSGSEYFKIWIVNILLTIITVGLYYPWAKVRNKRYFYANSTLAERNFEYHATGKQLFVGFLIGVILFIIYTFVTQTAPQLAGAVFLVVMLVLPWIIWRSLMFNLKVSSFSNVHFSFRGSLKTSYLIFLGYPLIGIALIALLGVLASVLAPSIQMMEEQVLIVLVVILSIMTLIGYLFFIALIRFKSKQYTVNNTYYGQGKFSAAIELKAFLKIYVQALGITLIPLLVLGALFSTMFSMIELVFILAYPVFFIIMFGVMAFVISRERQYVYANTLLDNKIKMKSTLRARDLAFVMITNMLLIVITLGLATPWAKVRMANLMLSNTLVETSEGFEAYITQQQDNEGAVGDQIGDAFDVNMDVGF